MKLALTAIPSLALGLATVLSRIDKLETSLLDFLQLLALAPVATFH